MDQSESRKWLPRICDVIDSDTRFKSSQLTKMNVFQCYTGLESLEGIIHGIVCLLSCLYTISNQCADVIHVCN